MLKLIDDSKIPENPYVFMPADAEKHHTWENCKTAILNSAIPIEKLDEMVEGWIGKWIRMNKEQNYTYGFTSEYTKEHPFSQYLQEQLQGGK
jgi:hypothetical protein